MWLENLFSIFQRKKAIPGKQIFTESFSEIVTAGSSKELFSITIPVKAKFRFLSFKNSTASFDAWGFIYWIFTLNGVPLYPYEHILDQIDEAEPLELSGGSTLKITGYNPTAQDLKMGIALSYELQYQE